MSYPPPQYLPRVTTDYCGIGRRPGPITGANILVFSRKTCPRVVIFLTRLYNSLGILFLKICTWSTTIFVSTFFKLWLTVQGNSCLNLEISILIVMNCKAPQQIQLERRTNAQVMAIPRIICRIITRLLLWLFGGCTNSRKDSS